MPKKTVEGVLEKIHSSPYSGHLGRRKTLSIMSERFYRPGLADDVVDYVKICDTCQKIKTTRSDKSAEIHNILPTRTNQLVATDLAGPFKPTIRGNRYLIVIVDCFGKYLVCAPVPNKETKTVAQAILEKWCWIFGIPEKILSDQGKEHKSAVWDSICNLLDIEKLHTTAYHPQCDGQSEKAVQQIKKMIRAHVDEQQDDWDIGLSQLCFSYNSSVHETTGVSPFYFMFGRESIIPVDLVYPNRVELTRERITEAKLVPIEELVDIEIEKDANIKEVEILPDITTAEIEQRLPDEITKYTNELKQRMENCFRILNRNKLTVMNRAKQYHDRRIRKKEYQLGDWVLSNHPHIKKGLSRGLAPRYYGPFIIVGKHQNKCDYLIRPANQPKARVRKIHQDNLKMYFKRGYPLDNNNDESQPIPSTQPTKREYKKDPNNPRWNKKKDVTSNEAASSSGSELTASESSYDAESSSDNAETSPPKPLTPPKRRRRKPKTNSTPTPNVANKPTTTTRQSKSGRIIKPPDRLNN